MRQFSPLDMASSVLLVTIFSMYWIELLKASSKSKIPENFAAAHANFTVCGERDSEI